MAVLTGSTPGGTTTRQGAIHYHNNCSRKCRKRAGQLGKTQPQNSKIPPREELEKLLWEIPSTQIAKRYGVSDSVVVKWAKRYGISKPPRGYWTKVAWGKV